MRGTYEERTGDLLALFNDGEFDIIGHQCNCFHRMGKGIAKQIKEQYPGAYEADLLTRYGDINKLGTFSVYRVPGGMVGGTILNIYGQYRYGREKRHTDYAALEKAFKEINRACPGKRIGLPKLGCFNAGGDWNVVKKLIQEHLKDMQVTIVTQ